MSVHNSLVATYTDHRLARIELDKLQNTGFDMKNLRLVARDSRVVVPGVSVLNSLGDLDVSLFDCIPEGDLVDYEAELEKGRWVLVAHGSPEEIERVWQVAEDTHPTNWEGVADATVYYGCAD